MNPNVVPEGGGGGGVRTGGGGELGVCATLTPGASTSNAATTAAPRRPISTPNFSLIAFLESRRIAIRLSTPFGFANRYPSARSGFSTFNRADQRWRPISRRTTPASLTQLSWIERRWPIWAR